MTKEKWIYNNKWCGTGTGGEIRIVKSLVFPMDSLD